MPRRELARLRSEVQALRGERDRAPVDRQRRRRPAEGRACGTGPAGPGAAPGARTDNSALEADLGFFERLLPASGDQALQVRALQADRRGRARLRYQLLRDAARAQRRPVRRAATRSACRALLDGQPWTHRSAGRAQGPATATVRTRRRHDRPSARSRAKSGAGAGHRSGRGRACHRDLHAVHRSARRRDDDAVLPQDATTDPQPDRRGHPAAVASCAFADGLRIDGEVHGDVLAEPAGRQPARRSARKPVSMARSTPRM